ncbi:MAG: hypothetical protein U0165_11190 [Polyangiaceae bacterium]
MLRPSLAVAALVLAVGSFVSACRPSNTPASLQDGLSCGQRLVGGAWRFTGFNPNTPTDPQRSQAITALQQSIRLTFDGQTTRTTGTNVSAVNPYSITSDDGVSCKVVAADPQGIRSETQIRFLDPYHIEVLDEQSQMPGRSSMERVPVGQ